MEGSYGQELARQGGRFGASSGGVRWRHQRLPRPDDYDRQQALADYDPEWVPDDLPGRADFRDWFLLR